jgi:hypothetical protein
LGASKSQRHLCSSLTEDAAEPTSLSFSNSARFVKFLLAWPSQRKHVLGQRKENMLQLHFFNAEASTASHFVD